MNEITLEKVDLVNERAFVTYLEAKEALEHSNGDVLEALIYIEKNQTSKFNPLKDSLMIYKLFGKYIFASLSAFVIDIILFNLFIVLVNNIEFSYKIVVATILARIISSLYNFKINAKMVFKNMNKNSFIKYVILVLIQMMVSAFSVQFLSRVLPINTTVIKIIVDAIIFMVNFVVQREIVFKNKKKI